MSGGERNRKKVSRGVEGWEEAGGEFYQESYPSTDTDLDVLQRDPKQLHTLLPSKKTRAVAATTVKRVRADTKTLRRQTQSRTRSRRGSTARRPSQAADAQVSMLPDLSEDLSNEQTTWEEIMQIKSLPISMLQKRDMKMKLQSEPNLRLQGYEQFKWKRRKIWERLSISLNETRMKLGLWRGDLKKIEGYCGTGVVTYFLFIKWLIYLNIVILGLITSFQILPYLLLTTTTYMDCLEDGNRTECFNVSNGEEIEKIDNPFFSLVEGTGWLGKTIFFQGFYVHQHLEIVINNQRLHYDLPLAYILVTLICFLLSLVAIVKAASRDLRERLVEGEGQFYRYSNLIFGGGWDFCIHNEKTAEGKKRAIYTEIKMLLETELRKEEIQNRTKHQKVKLFVSRLLVNVMVVIVLTLCACAIYLTFDYSSTQTQLITSRNVTNANVEMLAYEYMPSVTIVGFNLVVPFVFSRLVTLERYTTITVVRITLIRTIFLRFFALAILYASLYTHIVCTDSIECKPTQCWETFVGQHIYKLVLTDFAVRVFLTFFVNFPRALIARRFKSKLAKFIGEQNFELPKQVIDLVYSQTLCWLGFFYAPILPALAVITLFFTFYIKKFACLVNSKPTSRVYRVSRSNNMYMIVLLLSYVFALIPILFAITELTPSKSCGPFHGLSSAWDYLSDWFKRTPILLQDVVYFMTTAGFAVPIFILLILLLYYYWAVSDANRHMVIALKNQLVLEGHDKQFLLDRLSMVIKQQHENRKRMHHAEVMREGERNVSSN